MILHILAPGPAGGLETVVRLLAAGQQRQGQRVAAGLVLDPGHENHPLGGALRAAGVAVEPLVVPLRGYRSEWRALEALFLRLQPSVVHLHGYRADVIAGAVARRLGIPTVTTVHGFTGGGWKNRLYERLQRRSFRRAAAVIAVSRPLVGKLVADGVAPERIHCIPNAWADETDRLDRAAARRELHEADEPFLVGWVGRLSREKGPDVFVRALALLQDLPVRAVIIGGGRCDGELEALAGGLGIAERIRWCGTIPDAARLSTGFDCFVLSSRTEGTPMALFEAMAARVPIVATRVGGVPDVVSATEALLVPPDDPEALATAIRSVYTGPDAAQRRAAAAARRLASEFALAPWLERHAELYRRLTPSTARVMTP